MKQKTLLFIAFLFVFFITDAKSNQASGQKTGEDKNCTLDRATKNILGLTEVKEADNRIDSLTNHKHGISYMTDDYTEDGINYYSFEVGYDSEEMFETYYWFYVNKDNCQDIRIQDDNGDIVLLEQWRKKTNFFKSFTTN